MRVILASSMQMIPSSSTVEALALSIGCQFMADINSSPLPSPSCADSPSPSSANNNSHQNSINLSSSLSTQTQTQSQSQPTVTQTQNNSAASQTTSINAAQSASITIAPVILRSLSEKIYEKRKYAAIEIEKIVKEWSLTEEYDKIEALIALLTKDYISSTFSISRNGGLLALAAVAVGIGSSSSNNQNQPETVWSQFLPQMILPVLSCFSDQDSRVRYYACESGYNIAKVTRKYCLLYLTECFDCLCKLVVDGEGTVRSAAELLDRLLKDTLLNCAALKTSNSENSERSSDKQENLSTFFDLKKLIEIIEMRMCTKNESLRGFIVNWLLFLDGIPEVDILSQMNRFISGIFEYLNKINGNENNQQKQISSSVLLSSSPDLTVPSSSSQQLISPQTTITQSCQPTQTTPLNGNANEVSTLCKVLLNNLLSELKNKPNLLIIQKTILILKHFIKGNVGIGEECQYYAFLWINELVNLAGKDLFIDNTSNNNISLNIFSSLSEIIESVLIAQSQSSQIIVTKGIELNTSLLTIFQGLTSETESLAHIAQSDCSKLFHIVSTHILDRNERTRLSALDWLIAIHKRWPTQIKSLEDETFPFLIASLKDKDYCSEEVIRRDLKLLAQIAQLTDEGCTERFICQILLLIYEEREELLVTDKNNSTSSTCKGITIIKQVVCCLGQEKVYLTFATWLTSSPSSQSSVLSPLLQDIPFLKKLIHILNFILLTSEETFELRKKLKSRDNHSHKIFSSLFKCWCIDPISALSLCLISQNYYLSFAIIEEYLAVVEMTPFMLLQLDKLVQLLESPIFSFLRLSLLKISPEDEGDSNNPFLLESLYGILLLLPQSTAFNTLKNRLDSLTPYYTGQLLLKRERSFSNDSIIKKNNNFDNNNFELIECFKMIVNSDGRGSCDSTGNSQILSLSTKSIEKEKETENNVKLPSKKSLAATVVKSPSSKTTPINTLTRKLSALGSGNAGTTGNKKGKEKEKEKAIK